MDERKTQVRTEEDRVQALARALANTARQALNVNRVFAPMAVALVRTEAGYLQHVVLLDSPDERVATLRDIAAKFNPELLAFAADGYVTQFDKEQPCPVCLGESPELASCAECRGLGKQIKRQRQDALVVHVLRPNGTIRTACMRYRRVLDHVVFETPEIGQWHTAPAPYDAVFWL